MINLVKRYHLTDFLINFFANRSTAQNNIVCRSFSNKMVEIDAKLDAIPLVEIDGEGRFKYILINVYGTGKTGGSEISKTIVRGNLKAEWHGNNGNARCVKTILLIYVFCFS